jgi:hypothetical protein
LLRSDGLHSTGRQATIPDVKRFIAEAFMSAKSCLFLASTLVVSSLVSVLHAEEAILLDESWPTDVVVNNVVVSTTDRGAREGRVAAVLENNAATAGSPTVRFVAGEFELAKLNNARTQMTFWYQSDAFDGQFRIEVFAYTGGEPVKVLEGTANNAQRMPADGQWHEISVDLTPDAAQFSTLQPGQRYPLYVFFIATDGWGKTHRTLIDRVSLAWQPGSAEALIPEAGTSGDGWVWIEGEKPAAKNVASHPWWYEQVRTSNFSGGAALSHFSDTAMGEATYRFDAPAAGEHAFWVRANPTRNRMSYRLNEGEWTEIAYTSVDAPVNIAQDGGVDLRFLAWINAGKVTLAPGQNAISFRIEKTDAEQHHGIIDCFTFVSGAFAPKGLLKPNQVQVAMQANADENANWFDFAPVEETFAESPIDLRHLNEDRAGAGGWVRAQGDDFVLAGGEPVRFWAVNYGANDSFEDAQRVARTLAKYGVNMVRLHGSIFDDRGIYNAQKAQGLLNTIDAMAEQGIYSHLSIYFPLWMRPPADVPFLEGYDGTKHPFAALFFNRAFEQVYQDWWQQLLTSRSPRTGRTLLEEPALMGAEIINEDSYFFWTFNNDNIPDPQLRILETQLGQWLAKKYGSIDAAMTAWNGVRVDRDAPAEGRVGFRPLYSIFSERSPRDRDTARFLAESQKAFYERNRDYLRGLGFKGLITASNWTTASPEYFGPIEKWTYTATDFVDRHGYFGGKHEGEHAAWSLRDGHVYADRSALRFDGDAPGSTKDFGGHPVIDIQYGGKPSMISETTFTRPNRYRTEAPLFYAAYGALQDTDSFVHFALDSGHRWQVKPNFFMQPWTLMAPSQVGQFPATAMIYRLGLVDPGEQMIDLNVRVDDMLDLKGVALAQQAALDELRKADIQSGRTMERGGSTDPLVHYVGRTSVNFVRDAKPSKVLDASRFINRDAGTVTSSHGQLSLNFNTGTLRVNAPKAQAVSGNLRDAGLVELDQLRVASDMDLLHVIVVPLDDQPIATSSRMLMQVMSEERASGFATTPQGELKRITSIGRDPWQVRRMSGTVSFKRADAATLKVKALDLNGYPRQDFGTADAITLAPDVVYYLIQK